MRLGIIIQARIGSTRLPGKVMLPLPSHGTKTVLEHVVSRCKQVEEAAEVVIATTEAEADSVIVEEAERLGVLSFRGDEADVLKRYYQTAKQFNFDTVMRITSDCPCHDPKVLGDLVRKFINSDTDYASNTLERTFPHGLDAEIFKFDALEKAFHSAQDIFYREHVTPYIYKSGLFKVVQLKQENNKNTSKIRVTLDTPEDYGLLCAVFEFLGNKFDLFELEELFAQKKWLSFINANILQKQLFDSEKDEISAAINLLQNMDMHKAADVLKREA